MEPFHSNTVKSHREHRKRYLRYIYDKTFEYYLTDMGFVELAAGFEILFLEKRRSLAFLTFLHDLLRGWVSESYYLPSKMNIDVPHPSSKHQLTFRPSRNEQSNFLISLMKCKVQHTIYSTDSHHNSLVLLPSQKRKE